MTTEFEIAAETNDLCGEAPLWIEERGSLIWVDQGRSLVRQLTEGTPEVIVGGFAAGGIARSDDGSVILAGADGLARLSPSRVVSKLPLGGLAPGSCLNDICAAPNGDLLAGVMALSADATTITRPGALVRIAEDGAVQELDDDVLLPNGMGLSPDEQWLYVVDSARRAVLAYRTQDLGQPGARRREFATLSEDEGVPDGLAVDALGHVWLALWYSGQVVRLSAEGRIDRRLRLPFAQVSSLAFGGADARDLYVTTASAPWKSVFAPSGWSARVPQGGSLLRLRMEVPGAALKRIRDRH